MTSVLSTSNWTSAFEKSRKHTKKWQPQSVYILKPTHHTFSAQSGWVQSILSICRWLQTIALYSRWHISSVAESHINIHFNNKTRWSWNKINKHCLQNNNDNYNNNNYKIHYPLQSAACNVKTNYFSDTASHYHCYHITCTIFTVFNTWGMYIARQNCTSS